MFGAIKMFSKKCDLWYETNCPHCEKDNWVPQARDIDPDSIKCWNCKNIFYLNEEFIIDYYGVFCEKENPTFQDIIDEHISIDCLDGYEKPF